MVLNSFVRFIVQGKRNRFYSCRSDEAVIRGATLFWMYKERQPADQCKAKYWTNLKNEAKEVRRMIPRSRVSLSHYLLFKRSALKFENRLSREAGEGLKKQTNKREEGAGVEGRSVLRRGVGA